MLPRGLVWSMGCQGGVVELGIGGELVREAMVGSKGYNVLELSIIEGGGGGCGSVAEVIV